MSDSGQLLDKVNITEVQLTKNLISCTLFKKQDTETIIHFVAVLHHDSFTVNFRIQFKFHKKLSLAEKERVSSDYNHIIITSPGLLDSLLADR